MASPPVPPLIHRRTRSLRRLAISAATAITAVVAVVLPATPAAAKPSDSELRAQIAKVNSQIETIVEQYNGVHTKLVKDRAKSKTLAGQVNKAKLQVDVAGDLVGNIARTVYMTGPAMSFRALLDAGSTDSLLNELGTLDAVARSRSRSIDGAAAVVGKYQSQKDELDKLIASEAVQDKELASTKLQILSKLADLHKLQIQLGYVAAGAGASAGRFSRKYTTPVPCPQASVSGLAKLAVAEACSLLYPVNMYGWAQAGNGHYDCSGLTMTAWKAAGVSLDHFTGGQWSESHAIAKSSLRPGDLIFYNSRHHVAIYIGNGWIVQAEQTGEPIKESRMAFEPVVSSGYRRVNGT